MSLPHGPDPFGTEALRDSVLRAWRDSPTRFTEDTNAEGDLRAGGYRDRLLVELAQNAADAAAAAGTPGVLRLSVVDGELRAANTGAPLDAAGVASLSSLRASAKSGETVGRFGVGFAAVLAVTSAPRVVSRTGGVAFSEERTRAAAGRTGVVPVLRLPWPVDEREPALPAGFDTEVRLPLSAPDDGLLERLSAEAEDLLLALPWLARIELGEDVWTRTESDGVLVVGAPDGGTRRWLTHATETCVWAVPVTGDGAPVPLESGVLHAPTPTDERLSLPARLIASVPIEPSRRRVLPGAGVRAALSAAAAAYPGLVRELPARHRMALVPRAGFPLSEVDGELRELVLARLADTPWLPSAAGPDLTGTRAKVLSADSPALIPLLAELVTGLAAVPFCGHEPARVLAVAGAEQLTVAEVVELLTGVDREPGWWRSLYDALLPLVEAHTMAADELGGLPVPLADGRTLPGPRGALLFGADPGLLELLSEVDVAGLRLVHPDAAHALLEKLGAKHVEAADLLDAPALRDAVQRSVEDALSGLDTLPLAGAVLRLVAEVGAVDTGWLGALALPAEDGWRRADELVLPGSPLLEVFDPEAFGADAALDVLEGDFAEDWPEETLKAAGVLGGFKVLADDEPVEPDHGLPEEADWWASHEEPPGRLLAVRDLDLVADDAWPAALRLLASEPETWRALTVPGGHTGWWLARYALLAGRAPLDWRAADADGLAGLFDPVPELGLRPELLAAAGVRQRLVLADAEDVADLLDRLGDQDRKPSPGLVLRAYTALADAFTGEPISPENVRTLDGSVVDADRAMVLDQPWLLGVWPSGRLVAAADGDGRAHRLAELLDLPLAGERTKAEVDSPGEYLPWRELPAIGEVAELLDLPLPEGGLLVHERLTVALDGDTHVVPWWSGERLHAEDSPAGLARAFAWAAARWPDRHLIAALLDDPTQLLA